MMAILFWLLMIPIATVVLVRVTAFWADDGPGTVFGAVRTVLVMAAAVWLAFDFSSYLFACMMQDPQAGVGFPPNYHYWNWMLEPLALKWRVLGYVPFIRYLPVVFALCAGGIVQVLLWKIPFRTGMLVFVNQLVLDIFGMALLSLVFSFFVGVGEGASAKAPPGHHAGSHAKAHPGAHPAQHPGPHAGMRPGAHPGPHPGMAEPVGLEGMQMRIEQMGMEEGPAVRRLWSRWAAVNHRLKPVYDVLQPATRHLPLPVRDFVNGGGWLLLVPASILLALYWPRIRPRRAAHAAEAAVAPVPPPEE
jgi:hypothetical protein